jgi:hypothetical protein
VLRYFLIYFSFAFQFLSAAWAHFDAVEVAKTKLFTPSSSPNYTYYGYGKKKPLPKATAAMLHV